MGGILGTAGDDRIRCRCDIFRFRCLDSVELIASDICQSPDYDGVKSVIGLVCVLNLVQDEWDSGGLDVGKVRP